MTVWGKSFTTGIFAIESGTEHKEEGRQRDLKAVIRLSFARFKFLELG